MMTTLEYAKYTSLCSSIDTQYYVVNMALDFNCLCLPTLSMCFLLIFQIHLNVTHT